jgi:hypothetical protein
VDEALRRSLAFPDDIAFVNMLIDEGQLDEPLDDEVHDDTSVGTGSAAEADTEGLDSTKPATSSTGHGSVRSTAEI